MAIKAVKVINPTGRLYQWQIVKDAGQGCPVSTTYFLTVDQAAKAARSVADCLGVEFVEDSLIAAWLAEWQTLLADGCPADMAEAGADLAVTLAAGSPLRYAVNLPAEFEVDRVEA